MIDWGYVVAAAIVCEMVILVEFHRDTHWPSRSGADVLEESQFESHRPMRVQSAMLANRMFDLDELKAMFDDAKRANGEASDDVED